MDIIDTEPDSRGGAQSVDRALSLLTRISRAGDSVSIGALVAETGLSRPTVRRLLLALIRAGLVEQDATTRDYALGPEAYLVGLMAQRRFDIVDLAIDSLVKLSAESGDTSFLTLRRGAYGVCMHREDGDFPIRTQALQAGDRHPLGVGAGSLAILAALSAAEADAAIAQNTCALTNYYPNYSPALVHRLTAETRARGWSLNPGLNVANSWGIGVALRAPGGAVIGAFSIAALDVRLGPDRQETLAALLATQARIFEERLGRRLSATAALA
ncbi:IclR family transcriptional regulator [Acuticoccus sp. I52.16.1]|uniref:IclR family transcriptional regulator n=1 Tax=Acuticoccus sp. I52.16.1 TaxID=2928472 RepID=UPI001FD573B5|nr:IclR family transcriptional regulator [Acuticoccus sp. I52.16.1]UOM35404.1 IclR family transcriptional regulator [Acuticoccus sp. I52.16.1]